MKSICMGSIASLLVFAASTAFGATTFSLGFGGPGEFTGNTGDAWSADYDLTLDSAGDGTGAQGWSLSLSSDNASINSVTTNGTDVDALFSGGFKKSELTTKGKDNCAGKNGAVSAVVLSFTEPITLPAPPSASKIGIINAGGTIPAADGTATLLYVDNCQGAGQPVQNNITQDGATVAPVLGTKTINLKVVVSAPNCCDKQANVGFSSTSKSSSTPYDGIVEGGPDVGKCSAGGGTISVPVAEGATGSQHVFANISSNAAGDGVQGWSLSLAVNGDVEIASATTAGTVVDALFDGGFKKTETIDPAKNGGQRGAVSAIVLSFTNPVFLPSTGTASVLDFEIKASGPQGDADQVGSLKFQSGLKGAGQPVQNALTIGGATVDACNFGTASVNIAFTKVVGPNNNKFVRGNANNDTKVNIADPIWIINELFRSGPKSTCEAASDANGDGAIDAADAVYLIDYQFRGGSQPPGPFPACDEAPADKCAETQDGCKV